jgi:hypothetical protein
MSNIRAPKSHIALKAALATFGALDQRTAAYLLYRAAARNLVDQLGDQKASELIYSTGDAAATGEDL